MAWLTGDVNNGPGVKKKEDTTTSGSTNKNTSNNNGTSNLIVSKPSLDGEVINDLDNPDTSPLVDLYYGTEESINDHYDSQPKAWTGGNYGSLLNAAIDKINNREAFSYDLNADALYQQYKQSYMNQGKVAMNDAIGQASAMTGGYGNSYAATVANQQYQNYLSQLNDVVPQLYQLALNKYNIDTEELYNQAGLYNTMYGQEYSEYRDTVNDWNNELERLLNVYNNNRNYDLSLYQQQVAEDQWQKTFDENVRQFDLGYALQQAQLAKSGGSDGGKKITEDETPELDPAELLSDEEYYKQALKNGAGDSVKSRGLKQSYYTAVLSDIQNMSKADAAEYIKIQWANGNLTTAEYTRLMGTLRNVGNTVSDSSKKKTSGTGKPTSKNATA